MCWFSPSCSNDHIRIRTNMRILPSAITNIALKTREIIVGGIKRLTKKQAFLDKAILPQKMMSSEPVSSLFCDANNLDIFEFSCTIYSEGKKSSDYIWGILGARFMENAYDVLWNAFSDLAVLGILRFQLKSERPLNWRISLQGTIHLQPLSKDQDGHSSVHFFSLGAWIDLWVHTEGTVWGKRISLYLIHLSIFISACLLNPFTPL